MGAGLRASAPTEAELEERRRWRLEEDRRLCELLGAESGAAPCTEAGCARSATHGARDHALLLFRYNAGARADEAARLTVSDLDLGSSPAVKIVGKGRKVRLCPLWTSTAAVLKAYLDGRDDRDPVFLNRRGEAMTRFGIYSLVKRSASQAARRVPSISSKRVSPHVIRHTTAVHLLRAGVDINTIRAWLGHVSLETTNIYAEVDLEIGRNGRKVIHRNGRKLIHPGGG